MLLNLPALVRIEVKEVINLVMSLIVVGISRPYLEAPLSCLDHLLSDSEIRL